MFLYKFILSLLLLNNFLLCMEDTRSIIQLFFDEYVQDCDCFRNHPVEDAWYCAQKINPNPDCPVKSACFHPDGTLIIGCGTKESGTLYLYDIKDGEQTVFADNIAVTAAHISPSGKYLAVGEHYPSQLTLFDFATKTSLFSCTHKIGDIEKIVFDPKEKHVTTVGRFRSLTLVSLESQYSKEFDYHIGAHSMSFNPTEDVLAIGASQAIYFVDTNSGEFLNKRDISCHGSVNALTYSSCGAYLARAVNSNYRGVSNHGSLSMLPPRYPYEDSITNAIYYNQTIEDVKYHPSGEFLAVSTKDRDPNSNKVTIEIVKINKSRKRDPEKIYRYKGISNTPCPLNFNAAGNRLAATSSSGVLIFNAEGLTVNQVALRHLLYCWFQIKNQHDAIEKNEKYNVQILLHQIADDFGYDCEGLEATWSSFSVGIKAFLLQKIVALMCLHKEIMSARVI